MSRTTASPTTPVLPDPREPAVDELLERIDDRVLWLAVRMIHEANVVRPSVDGLKVGGHQASSASSVSIITELLLRYLRRGDVLAVKPHAGPAFHAAQYLMGSLPAEYLTKLRAKNGLQPYLSRTKDPDPVDFSLGSMGLGPVSPLFAAATDGYIRSHFERAKAEPARRFVAIVGDAELDEGNVWEAIEEETLVGLGNVTWIVDLNRQSLDRVIPGIRVNRTEASFAAAGWQVFEAKYGRHLRERFGRPGGEVLRRRIDEMSNEEYQALLRTPGAEARERLIGGASADDRDPLSRLASDVDDAGLTALLADLGGHDHSELARLLAMGDADPDRPTVIFAYTIKGWKLPFAGDAANHSALMTTDQITALAPTLGVDADDPWAAFPDGSPESRWANGRRIELYGEGTPERSAARGLARRQEISAEVRLEARVAPKVSTQMAFGDVLTEASRHPELAARLVTTSADVAVSTNLGGWINKVGVYDRHTRTIFDETPRLLKWQPNPSGQHIELGISEMNLFTMLGSLGLSAELLGEPLIPIGTVYDTFISRGLDALIFSLYNESRFILAATPSGVSLAPEGGAHQSTITPSLGIELPNLRAYEPTFAREVAWCLEEGIAGCVGERAGYSTYLRLTTRPVDQSLANPIKERVGEEEWRRLTLAGGYLLLSGRDLDPSLPADAPRVTIAAMGAIVPEAVDAVRFLVSEEVDVNLVVVTSADRIQAEIAERRLASVRDGIPPRLEHLESLFPGGHRHAPIVTVLDGASHALSFLGGAFGAPVVPLGSDRFGQTGTIPDLYAAMGFDTPHIVEAALLAAELRESIG
jgi:pyruvate dehydrogenase E1 component